MFYYVCKAKYLWQNEEVSKEINVNIIYVFTGEWQEAKFKIIGDNGIIVGPVTEYEANEQRFALMHDYPDTKFEIKEVK